MVFLRQDNASDAEDSISTRTLADMAQQWSLPVDFNGDSTFILSGDRIYFMDGRNRLLAINATNGSIAWEHQAGLSSGPVLASGNTAYIQHGSRILALDAATGRTRWDYSARGKPSGLSLSQGSLYALDPGGMAFSIDAATGRTRWTSRSKVGSPSGDSVICSGILFAGAKPASRTDESDTGLFGWDVATGELVWRFPHKPREDGLGWKLIAGGDMFFAAYNADLLAFRAA
ncbi:PQQ-binding-like beta-propeller repeat protein [Actinomadura rugatobispora]|uniref:PQQ-binding-like beta-propeller repeat protein n=1 Tax=Actinomadura rugatobispora TaxID=1994 RepID=A0ABW1A6H4_9ACTN|nr:hypothetical protein GCM10010200_082460 [Actinomadura rugatobispora]